MPGAFTATSTIEIDAAPERVWSVLTDPEATREFMFGTELVTDWAIGEPIRWRGVWEGRPYEDHGVVLEFAPPRLLAVTHFSPLSGADDVPGNHHTLRWTLEPRGRGTLLTLTQDNAASEDEAAHSKTMWDSAVASVKAIAER